MYPHNAAIVFVAKIRDLHDSVAPCKSLLGYLMTNLTNFVYRPRSDRSVNVFALVLDDELHGSEPLYVAILMCPDCLQSSRTLVIFFATVVCHCTGLNSCCVSSGVSEIIIFTNVLFWISSLPSNLFLKMAMCFVCFKSLVTKTRVSAGPLLALFIVRSPVARFSSRQPSSVLLLRIPLRLQSFCNCELHSCWRFPLPSNWGR